MKKIKVFLGGYVNSVNAQNINCRALAKNLNKEKFEICALKLYSGTLETEPLQGVQLIDVFYPHKISKYFAYTRGIMWADIVYLPKGEMPRFNTFLMKFLKKRSFNTVEGVLDELAQQNAIRFYGSIQEMLRYYRSFDKLFSITAFMKEKNKRLLGLETDEKILYLGTDIETFLNENKKIDRLEHAILIGNDLIRKGIYDYLEIAKAFPKITFHVVGSGNGKIEMNEVIERESFQNIKYHGSVNHDELTKILENVDLHIFPSRSEGFPKVTLETAAAGVPSLVYDNYGADEWITHNKDGFVVHSLDEMKETIKMLQANPKYLQKVSKNTLLLAKHFDWKVVVREWESVIYRLAKENKS